MKIAVIDDERPSRKELIHQILSVIADSLSEEADSGSNALELISSRPFDPVSYTHLDVYKRQPLRCFHRQVYSPVHTPPGHFVTPVSYTHLDVYKRQMLYSTFTN